MPDAVCVLTKSPGVISLERGAVLFCDLTGFSRMGAQAIAHSERGAEDLRAELNSIFEQVDQSIAAHGGHLLYYAGDAVAAFWPDDKISCPVNVAAVAGRGVQKTVRKLGVGLSMRAGVTYGDLWLIDLALPTGSRLPVFCGPALEALKDLSLSAQDVALCAAAREVSTGRAVPLPVSSKTRGIFVAGMENGSDPTVWPGPHHRAGLVQGADWLAEFRRAHILYARLSCPHIQQETDVHQAGDIILAAVTTVEAEGGTLLQVCQDDKGIVLVAAWQLATSGWEDGAERAVISVQDLARQGARGAVTGGKVFAGLIGGKNYKQYVVVGDAINRAAGMAMLPTQSASLDAATADAVARRFETAPIAELILKGQEHPSAVYGIIAEQLRGIAHAGTLVGRETEKTRLRGLTARIAAGERSDIVIMGEAGLGKSRLADWLEGVLEDAGCKWLSVKGDGIRRSIGYTPMAPLIQSLLSLTPTCDEQTCRSALAILGRDAQLWLALLNPVLPVALPQTVETLALTEAGRAERTREPMTELLSVLLPPKAVLGVDDAHWLDSASWQLVESVTRNSTISIVLVTRPISPDDLPSEARRLLDEARVEVLHLAPLSEDEAGALAAQSLDANEAAPSLTAFLYSKAAGHPLFTAALAQTLLTRDLIRIEAGYAHLRLGKEGLAELSLPTDVASTIAERIAAVPPAEQLTLKACAVLGRTFDEVAASEIPPSADLEQVRVHLRSIEETGLVERLAKGSWRFHHAIIADVGYAALTSEQARRLHANAGQNIARRAGTDHDQSDLVLLAHHAERAGQIDAALCYLTAAAANARQNYANLEVIEFLTRASTLAADRVDALTLGQWRYDIASALRALGQYQRSEDFLRHCITDLDRPPPQTKGQAIRKLLSGYITLLLRSARPPRSDAQRAPMILAADATMMLSEIHYELNKIPFALAEILHGANLARWAGGDSVALAKLYIGMSLISTSLPWALDGDALQEQALDVAGRLGDPATEAWVLMVSGNYETGKAGWDRGASHFLRSMEIAEAAGERKTWETSASTMGNLRRLEGYFADAKGWSDVTLAHSRDRGIVQGVIWSHNGRARDLLCLSAWDEMRDDVEALNRLLADPANALDANDNNQLVFHYTQSVLMLDEGNEEGAIAALDAALSIVARTARPQVYMTQNAAFYCDLVHALWMRGRRDAAMVGRQKLVAKSAARIGRQYRAGIPMAHLAAGDVAWITGKIDAARKAWRSSALAAEERGMLFNAAHAHDRLSRTGLEDLTAVRDRHLKHIGIKLPRLWRLDT